MVLKLPSTGEVGLKFEFSYIKEIFQACAVKRNSIPRTWEAEAGELGVDTSLDYTVNPAIEGVVCGDAKPGNRIGSQWIGN